MRRIDMSAEAVTARLKLVSQLRRLSISLGTAKLKPKIPVAAAEDEQNIQPASKSPSRASK
jgi:hypothetical protein